MSRRGRRRNRRPAQMGAGPPGPPPDHCQTQWCCGGCFLLCRCSRILAVEFRHWRGIPPRRQKEFARSGPKPLPQRAQNLVVFTGRNVLRANRQTQCEIETHAKIHNEGGCDSECCPDQRALAQHFRATGSNAKSERTGGESYVADVQRKAEEMADGGGHSEHESEDDRAAPRRDVGGKRFREFLEPFGLEGGAEAMLGDGSRKLVVDRPV